MTMVKLINISKLLIDMTCVTHHYEMEVEKDELYRISQKEMFGEEL